MRPVAPWTPSLSYICCVNSGKTAPMTFRTKLMADSADDASFGREDPDRQLCSRSDTRRHQNLQRAYASAKYENETR